MGNLINYQGLENELGRQTANRIVVMIEELAGIHFDFMDEAEEPERLERALTRLKEMSTGRRVA